MQCGRYVDAQISSKESKMYNKMAVFIGIFACTLMCLIILICFIPFAVLLYY